MSYYAPTPSQMRQGRIRMPNSDVKTAGEWDDYAERHKHDRDGVRPGDDRPKGPPFPRVLRNRDSRR